MEKKSQNYGMWIAIVAIVVVGFGLWYSLGGNSAGPAGATPTIPSQAQPSAMQPNVPQQSASPRPSVNTPPRIPQIDYVRMNIGQRFELILGATDADGEELTYRLLGEDLDAKGLTLENGMLIFAPQQAGTVSFRVAVSDGMDETITSGYWQAY